MESPTFPVFPDFELDPGYAAVTLADLEAQR
jgi:hypothetical protein